MILEWLSYLLAGWLWLCGPVQAADRSTGWPDISSTWLEAISDDIQITEVGIPTIEVKENMEPVVNLGRVICTGEDTPTFDPDKTSLLGVNGTCNQKPLLQLKKRRDYEVKNSFPFRIKLPNQHRNGLLKVLNVNDNTPYFKHAPSNLYVPENQKIDVPGGVFHVTDDDVEDSKKLVLIIEESTPEFVIRMDCEKDDGCTGQLSVMKPLDYEKQSFFMLTVTVQDPTDKWGNRWNSSISVFVFVTDVGDQPPQWQALPSTHLIETDEVGRQVLTVKAVDGDREVQNEVTYEIVGGSNLFAIDPATGSITVKHPVDREQLIDTIIILDVKATEIIKADDSHTGPFSSNAMCTIYIDDKNDNFPEFKMEQYTVTIPEDWDAVRPIPFADDILVEDRDTRENAEFIVTLEGTPEIQAAFQLSGPSMASVFQTAYLTIKITDPDYVDYEVPERRQITFQLKATEVADPSHTGWTKILINLEDANDNSPEFLGVQLEEDGDKYYTAHIPEDASQGFKVFTVEADDRDIEDEFGKPSIRYKFINQLLPLEIDSVTGVVTVNTNKTNFDYEREPLLEQEIRALDGRNEDRVILKIQLTDINDEAPKISAPFEVSMLEERHQGFVVTQEIQASDPDSDHLLVFSIDWDRTRAFLNGYAVRDYSRNLGIATEQGTGNATGVLKVQSPGPNREEYNELQLVIVVEDQKTKEGLPENKGRSHTEMKLWIKDINDNKPVFVEDYSKTNFTVTERTRNDSTVTVARLRATDADEKSEISYSSIYVYPDTEDLITINPTSGEMKVSGDIDREKIPILKYTVTATDNGEPPLQESVTVTIIVEDINDCIPEFLSNFKRIIEIPENSKAGTHITTVKAVDKDEGVFQDIEYSLDIRSPIGLYQFEVHPITGEVTVREGAVLDRENPTLNKFELFIIAKDWPRPGTSFQSNTDFVNITITLTDVNDEEPKFTAISGCAASPEESTLKDDFLVMLEAHDKDEQDTDNSRLTYSIKSITPDHAGYPVPDGELLFKVETQDNKANLSANREFKDIYGNFTVVLEASDHGKESKSGEGSYSVCILDINDHYPQFTFPPRDRHMVKVPVNLTLGPLYECGEDCSSSSSWKLMSVIHASDADKSENNRVVRYKLIGSENATEFFFVSNISGQVFLKQALSLAVRRFELQIEATDLGTEPLKNMTTLIVHVSNVKNYPPEFTESQEQAVFFYENKISAQPQLLQTASDLNNIEVADDELPDPIYYFIVGGDKSFFTLTDAGLTTTMPLDREKKNKHSLVILASNSRDGAPGGTLEFDPDNKSMLLVTVKVLDENDEIPTFNQTFFGGIVTEDRKGKEVTYIQAVDLDLDDEVKYSIIPGTVVVTPVSDIELGISPFILSQHGNETAVVLNFLPDESMKGFIQFEVMAVDSVGHNDTTSVKIYMCSKEDRLKWTFINPEEMIRAKKFQLINIFSSNFGYQCNINDILSVERQAVTTVITYFVDERSNEVVTPQMIYNIQNEVAVSLQTALMREGLVLDSLQSPEPHTEENLEETLENLLIVVSVILSLLIVALLTAFCFRTRQLQREVKALSTNTYGSKDPGLNQVGNQLPNTNKHAIEGSNPLYTQDETEVNDNTSQGSGDSVLIGVEDNPEFRNYTSGMERVNRVFLNGSVMSLGNQLNNNREEVPSPHQSLHEFHSSLDHNNHALGIDTQPWYIVDENDEVNKQLNSSFSFGRPGMMNFQRTEL